jgi:hypothetical protein
MLSLNCKDVQHVKIYLPCNFEVNPITHFGVISLFSSSSNGQLKFHPPFFLFLAWWPSWLEVGLYGHNIGRGPFHQSLVAIGPVVSEEKIKILL